MYLHSISAITKCLSVQAVSATLFGSLELKGLKTMKTVEDLRLHPTEQELTQALTYFIMCVFCYS